MIKSMGDNKAPRVDGYKAKKFKASWSVINQDVVNAV